MDERPQGDAPLLSTHGQELESLVDRFEEAWQAGAPPAIDDFLPTETEPRHAALVALVAVDLEYRWKLANSLDSVPGSLDSTLPPKPAGGLPPRPRVEDYLREFPDLGALDALPPDVIVAEYRARHRWGDRPAQSEYATRFAALAETLRVALSNVDKELAAIQMNLSNDGHGSPQAGRPAKQLGESHAKRTDRPDSADGALDQGSAVDAWPTMVANDFSHAPAEHGLPKSFGRYTVTAALGEGGDGVVYRGFDTELCRDVAIKVPRRERLPGSPMPKLAYWPASTTPGSCQCMIWAVPTTACAMLSRNLCPAATWRA